MPRRVFITAAEVSGDGHAAQLIHSLRALDPSLIFEGHGGLEMEAAGAIIHHETTRRAAMSWKAARRVGEVWNLLQWTKRYFDRSKPDLQVCVDSPAMNFHFARAAHQRGIPVLYYIAPQLWAWRENRVVKLRKWVDRVACILPFEEEFFRNHGVDATFVGHPLFDELPPTRGRSAGLRYPDRPPIIGLLPGSRQAEAKANFPHMLQVAAEIRRRYPKVRFLVPTTHATHSIVGELVGRTPDIEFAQRQFDLLVPQCDLCVAVSGTATLHVAGHGVPMIVVYRGSPVLWHLIGRFLIKTRTFALVNLLNEGRKHIVPEFVPWYGSPKPLLAKIEDFLQNPQLLRDQETALDNLVSLLNRPGASMNTAKIAMQMMG